MLPVRLQPNAAPYLAVLIDRELADHALLYLYDAREKLVYHEVLPTSGEALGVLPGSGRRGRRCWWGRTGVC